jgi:hypothetical protein
MAGAAPSVSGLPLSLLGITGTHGGRTDPLSPNAGVMVPNNPGVAQGKSLGKTLAGVAGKKPGSVPGYTRGPGVLPPVGTPAPGAAIPPIAPGAPSMLDQNGVMGLGSGYRPPSGQVRQTFGPMPLAGNPVNSKGVAESVFAGPDHRRFSQARRSG